MTLADFVQTALATHGPMRASHLAAYLTSTYGLSPDAAKQRVSRASAPILKFPIRLLPKNEAFLYHQDDRNSEKFWEALVRSLRESSSIYGLALDGLIARGGLAQRPSFNVVAGAPEAQKKQVPLSGLLDNLVNAGLVERLEVGEMGECVRLKPQVFGTPDQQAFRARKIAEDVLMDGLREWTRKLGLASYNAIEIRNAERAPKFSTFHWDLSGPSYLLPLVSVVPGGRKPGFFVADVFCDGTLDVPNIQYFLRKVRMLKAMRRVVPFMPVLLADGYTKEALRAGKAAGIMMATTRTLFGDSIANALSSLIDTLTHAAAVAASNPDRLSGLLKDLSAIEGAAGNLRGALFEMIVGYLVREVEGNTIDIGEIVRDPTGKAAEIDVRRIKERQECWFYECRARQPDARIGADEISTWIERINRIMLSHLVEKRFQDCQFGFEIWTTGQFDDKALALLEQEKTKRTPIEIGWRDGTQVRDYAKRASCKAILDTLDEHYFKHPLRNRPRLDSVRLSAPKSAPSARSIPTSKRLGGLSATSATQPGPRIDDSFVVSSS